MTQHIVERLHGLPVRTEDAKRSPADGGLPDAGGFYAWWFVPGSLPGVPSHPHPNDDIELNLLYVGIAPNSGTSQQTVRTRVLNNHLGGNTGSSTFRFSLAALLIDVENFQPTMRKTAKTTKYVLSGEDNQRLSDWQRANLFLTWCEYAEPWRQGVEGSVIAAMQPPLNRAENSIHPFHGAMGAARSRFRDAARRAVPLP